MKGQGGGGTARGGGRTRSGGGTVAIQKTKARATTSIDDNIILLRKALFDDTGKDKNVCASMPAFMKFARNGLDLEISFTPKLTRAEADWAFEITKDNMEGRYDMSGYGWDDEDKHQTLTEQGARFLVIREWPEEEDAKQGEIVGFAHFRFTVQGEYMDTMAGEPCLILWDIHIEEDFQRRGLGKHILTLLELVARREGMKFLSVPVMLNDDVTLAWLAKAGQGKFSPDESLRSMIDFDPEMEGFDVYSKTLAPIAPAAAAPAATGTAATGTPAKEGQDKSKAEASPTSVFDFSAIAAAVPAPASAEAETEAEAEADGVSEGVTDADVDALPLREALGKLQALYFEKHQEEPTAEMVAQWRSVLSQEGEGEEGEEGEGEEVSA